MSNGATVGSLNVEVQLQFQQMQAQFDRLNETVSKNTGKISGLYKKAFGSGFSNDLSKSILKGAASFVTLEKAVGAIKNEIAFVVGNIDKIQGVSPETIASIQRMNLALAESKAKIDQGTAVAVGWVAQAADGWGNLIGRLVYGQEAAADGWKRMGEEASEFAKKQENLKRINQLLADGAKAAESYAKNVADFTGAISAEGRGGESTGQRIARLRSEAASMAASAEKYYLSNPEANRGSGGEGYKMAAEASKLRQEANRLQADLDTRMNAIGQQRNEQLREQMPLEERVVALRREAATIQAQIPSTSEWADPVKYEQAVSYNEQLLEVTGKLSAAEGELARQREADAEKAANSVRKYGESLTETKESVTEFQRETASMWNDVSDRAGQAFSDMVLKGENSFKQLPEIVASAMIQIVARMAIINPLMNAVFGGMGGWTALPSFFGGARAGGGSVDGGKTYLVGEQGPELFTASGSGMVIPAGVTSSLLSGGGGSGGTVLNMTYHIQGDAVSKSELVSALRAHSRAQEASFTDALSRGGNKARKFGG